MNVYTSEQVSNGHVDKLADQIADRVLCDCLAHDENSRVAIECLIKGNQIVIAGELSGKYTPDYRSLVKEVFDSIGQERLGYSAAYFDVEVLVRQQSPDIALGVDKGGAGDQGMVYGYATAETPELLPIPYMVATRFLRLLAAHPSRMFRADAKAQVSYDYDSGRITTFLCSVQHSEDVEPTDFCTILETLMIIAASEYGLNTDFEKLINPTGRFVIGGPFADCGVTGRKLACDSYGGLARFAGGALSGKDGTKVDRSGAYMARKIARDIVLAGYADKCEIQLAYAIGVAEPVGIGIDCFGTETQPLEFIRNFVQESYDLTPRGIIKRLHLLDVDYNKISAYGHFTNPDMPWEQ